MTIFHFPKTGTLALGLLAAPCLLNAQRRFDPPPDVVPLAVTYCYDRDSLPPFSVSFINPVVLGTDSLQEVVVHEARHDRMNRDSLAATGHCPGPQTDSARLDREVYAYCASDSVRVKRTHSIVEAGVVTVDRLVMQFENRIPVGEITRRWQAGCPAFPIGSKP